MRHGWKSPGAGLVLVANCPMENQEQVVTRCAWHRPVIEHFRTQTEHASLRATTHIIRRRCYVFPVLWMTSCFHNGPNGAESKTTRMLRRVHQMAPPGAKVLSTIAGLFESVHKMQRHKLFIWPADRKPICVFQPIVAYDTLDCQASPMSRYHIISGNCIVFCYISASCKRHGHIFRPSTGRRASHNSSKSGMW